MSDSLFRSRGKHAGCLLTRMGQGGVSDLHGIRFSVSVEGNTKTLTPEAVDTNGALPPSVGVHQEV